MLFPSDVFVFGVSSLIILCSACIFLAGVIVLKRYDFSRSKTFYIPVDLFNIIIGRFYEN